LCRESDGNLAEATSVLCGAVTTAYDAYLHADMAEWGRSLLALWEAHDGFQRAVTEQETRAVEAPSRRRGNRRRSA
jgi:hypothetical protein